jgi:membrane associated rhomboid family serine protease
MSPLADLAVVACGIAIVGWLVGVPIVTAIIYRRRDRRRMLAEGVIGQAVVTKIAADRAGGTCTVTFQFEPANSSRRVECRQESTQAAVRSARLSEGSSVRIHYLAKWPSCAFIATLALAERIDQARAADPSAQEGAPSVHFVSYADPVRSRGARKPTNSLRWSGSGDIAITSGVVRFTAMRRRPFWFPGKVEREFSRDSIANVEAFGNAVSLQVLQPYEKALDLKFWTVSDDEAQAIAAQLPDVKTPAYSPQMAEQAGFASRLLAITPRAPVTPALIAVNVAVFLVVVAMGGGFVAPNPEVMIRLGSDYTPLTLGGEWWRLFTSTFLHFGLIHLAFNMWALYANGILAERIFGSSRYLLIYVVAGLAGSVASLLWHPIVNGAGASGAIFGVLGAQLAFFLRNHGGVPPSVLKSQRNSAAVFIAYSLLNGARVQGIDNAAHLGGLLAGLVLGFLLARPLDAARGERTWTAQWIQACAVTAAAALAIWSLLANGQLHPRPILDKGGHPIPLAALGPPVREFGGVRLEMTRDDVLRIKGQPVARTTASQWVYNSLDAAHDGLIDVFFGAAPGDSREYVQDVFFTGQPDAAPPELPRLMGLTRPNLVAKYGEPLAASEEPRGQRLWFRTGVVVFMHDGRAVWYGIGTNR